MGAIGAFPPSLVCNNVIITPHWNVFSNGYCLSFILSSEVFQMYRWYCSCTEYISTSGVYIWELLGRKYIQKKMKAVSLFCWSFFPPTDSFKLFPGCIFLAAQYFIFICCSVIIVILAILQTSLNVLQTSCSYLARPGVMSAGVSLNSVWSWHFQNSCFLHFLLMMYFLPHSFFQLNCGVRNLHQ